jgi:hypothetical protein
MKFSLILFAIPFATILICVLLICAVFVAPFFLLGYIWSTRERNERRQSENYPLKDMIQKYKSAREVRK